MRLGGEYPTYICMKFPDGGSCIYSTKKPLPERNLRCGETMPYNVIVVRSLARLKIGVPNISTPYPQPEWIPRAHQTTSPVFFYKFN